MKYAKYLENWFCNLPRDERGFTEDNTAEFLQWKADLSEKGVSFCRECPNSVDSTIEITFYDGSKARYGNPKQWSFPAYFSAERL